MASTDENSSWDDSGQTGSARIDAFLAELSPWDLLYLRNAFRSGRVPIHGLAGLADLPPEILCVIATHLDLEDIGNCRLVCRAWCTSWKHGAVTTGVCRFFFPGLLEKHEARNDPRPAGELLLYSTMRHLRRRHGLPLKSSFIFWDSGWSSAVFQNLTERTVGSTESPARVIYYPAGPPVFYDKNRLAWQSDKSLVIVDDLSSCIRRICTLLPMTMMGRRLVLQGMSHMLLIFAATSGDVDDLNYNFVQIWHVDSGQWQRVTLPGPFSRCFVDGNRAAFVTRQGLVVSYSWGGRSVDIDLSGELNRPPKGYEGGHSLPGVILHPDEPGSLYVASMYRSTAAHPNATLALDLDPQSHKRTFMLSVVRYDDGMAVKRWLERIRTESMSSSAHHSVYVPFRITLLCSKMDANGLYNLGTLLTASYEFEHPRVVEFATVGFSIYRESFVQRPFNLIKGSPATKRICCHFDASTWGLQDHEERLTTWASGGACTPRWFDLAFAERKSSYKGKRKRPVDIYMFLGELNKCVPVSEACRVYGDEEFEIFITTHGILVWSYTETTELPVVDSVDALTSMMTEHSLLMEPVASVDLKPFAG